MALWEGHPVSGLRHGHLTWEAQRQAPHAGSMEPRPSCVVVTGKPVCLSAAAFSLALILVITGSRWRRERGQQWCR